MSFEDYNKEKIEVIALLSKLQTIVGERAYVSQKINSILEDSFTISVLGHFSTGKSSFLNALMGFEEDILPQNERASTSAITVLKSSQGEQAELNKMARIHFRSGDKKIVKLNEIQNYIARNEEIEVDKEIQLVEIFLESEFLRNGIQLVDTPGINSIYTLEKDIIKQQVQESDACLYMFSYDKPGTEVEFKFLNYVNKYLGRIFFILNKVDLEDKSEENNSVEKTMMELRNKMKLYNIDALDKRIFPISVKALRAGEKKASGMDEFMKALYEYLSGDENASDRLLTPLKYVQAKLLEEKETVEEKIIICSDNGKMLSWYIQDRKQKIETMGEEIKQKKIKLKRSIEAEIRRGKELADKASSTIMTEVKEKFSDYSNELQVTLTDFTDVSMEVYDSFLKQWGEVRDELHSSLCGLIDENIDDDVEEIAVREKLNQIIYEKLDFEREQINNPQFDFSRLKNIDKEIERARNEYFGVREKLSRIRNEKVREQELRVEIDRLKEEMKNLKKEKETRLQAIEEVTPRYRKERIFETVYRTGTVGAFFDSLLGPRVIQRSKSVLDDKLYKFNTLRKREIDRKYSLELQLKEKRLHEHISKIAALGDIDYSYDTAKFELEGSSKEYYDEVRKNSERKEKMEQMIVKFSIDNYLSEVNEVCGKYKREWKSFLDNGVKLLTNVMMSIFKSEEEKLIKLKESIYDITELGNKTPEELREELKRAYEDRDKIATCIKMIGDYSLNGSEIT